MQENLIPNDVSRCSNHRCVKRANCKRYMQNQIDRQKQNEGILAIRSITRFYEHNCRNYLAIITKLVIIILFYSQAVVAQRDFKTVFSVGIDPKMAIEGPHKGRVGNAPSLDYEVSFGFEWQHTRLLMQAKSHKEVNFFKWTYLQFDYKQALFSNIYAYGGLEVGQIRKTHPDAHYSNPDNYRSVTINPFILGANLELQYKMLDNRFGLGIQGSIYQAEDELKPYKKYRKEVTATLFFYL